MEPIEEQLARLAEHLRGRLQRQLRAAKFGPKPWTLPKPRICVMEPKRSQTTEGWHSAKRWRQGFVNLNEIVFAPWAVDKGVLYAAGVLVHEFTHLANAVARRKDTSRQGRYHNGLYRETAIALGLVVEMDSTFGWCETALGKKLAGFVRELIREGVVDAHVFRYQRKATPRARPSLVKLVADCDCDVLAYVPWRRVDETVLRCGKCGTVLRPAKRPGRGSR